MNKERFHNELAMRLGYERIVKDKRITIQVDDSYYDTYLSLVILRELKAAGVEC